MRIIPVIDVLNSHVVRGIGGRRQEYRPIVSKLTPSTDPFEVAKALIAACQPREIYIADLDAIQGGFLALELYHNVRTLGADLWVDAGIKTDREAETAAEAATHVVAGLESVPSRNRLKEIVAKIGKERIIFSLDLRDGSPLQDWKLATPFDIAAAVIDIGIRRMIVLDLARVGVGSGTGTEDLCQRIASTYPHVEIIAGGGVTCREDLTRLAACGIRGALVASALHDGKLSAASGAA